MASISDILGSVIKTKVLGSKNPSKVSSEKNTSALTKVIGKNFMSLPGFARDLNVARQNIQKLVKLEGGTPARGADAKFLKASSAETKLDIEVGKIERRPAPEKSKKGMNVLGNLKKTFSAGNILKSLTKYLAIGAIVTAIFVTFKDSFAEWASGLWETIKEALDEFVGGIKDWFIESVQPIIDKVQVMIQPLIDAISGFITKLSDWFKEKIGWFAKEFPQTFAVIKNVIDKVMNLIDSLVEKLKDWAEKLLSNKATAWMVPDFVKKMLKIETKKEGVRGPGNDWDELMAHAESENEKKKLLRQQKEAIDTEEIKKQEKEKQYTGDDEIVRQRLGLPPKTDRMRQEEEYKRKTIETAPPPESIVVPSPVPSAPKEAAKPTPTPAPAAPGKAPAAPGAPGKIPSGTPGLIISELNKAGITSPKAHANVLATVKAESNFKPQSENLFYTAAAKIKATFGPKKIPSEEFAQQFVNNPEALANYVYKTTDGNSEPGDGFKYRGRGFIQHTGKNQYAALAKGSGIDLLSNPDSLNSPDVAAKVIPWFFLTYKRMKPDDMDNMSKVNRAIAFADPTGEKAKKRIESSEQIHSEMTSGSGSQMSSSSSEVASGQRAQAKPQTPMVVNAPTTNTTIVKKSQVASAPKQDTGSMLVGMAT